MRIFLAPILWLGLGSIGIVNAQTQCQWNTWQDIGKALVENSPELEVLSRGVSYRETLTDSAALYPPAVASGQYTAGGFPWKSSHLEASYLWTLESADKRSSRLGVARAGVESARLEKADKRARELLKLALIQQSLRRLESRREVLQETESTYRKIIGHYERRLTLGPEQEASLAVFRIAKKENDLKIETLDVEKSQLAFQLSVLTGCLDAKLPKVDLQNSVRKVSEKSDSVSSTLLSLKAQSESLELSRQAEIHSLSSDLSIGPMVIASREDDDNTLEIGVAASWPVGGARASVLSVEKTAETLARQSEISLKISRLEIDRAAWIDQYHKSVKALESGLSKEELTKTHKKLEKLFQGERVSAALVIEAHRQLLDHITSFTDLESKASEAFWNLQYLEGHIDWKDL